MNGAHTDVQYYSSNCIILSLITVTGDEGGFALPIAKPGEALGPLEAAVDKCEYKEQAVFSMTLRLPSSIAMMEPTIWDLKTSHLNYTRPRICKSFIVH